jgi:IS605 OrfB family transposase
MILRNDLVNIQKDRNFEGVYWVNVPVYPRSIHVRVQTSEKYDLASAEYSLGQCMIVRGEGEEQGWFLLITLRKPDKLLISADNVLSVDLGVNNMAVTVNTANTHPNFYGKEIREIRGHGFYLRRQLGKKKAFDTIKHMGNIEFLRIDHQLHIISKAIVDEAVRTNAIIIIGRLKGIRKRLEKSAINTLETTVFDKKIKMSRRVRRLIGNFPYFALGQYIKYKAQWVGVRVVEISEAYTSQTCFFCQKRSKKSRKTQGLFLCKFCNKEMNADFNGAMNLLQRGLGTLSSLGGLRHIRRCFAKVSSIRESKTELAYPKPVSLEKETDELPMIVDRNNVIRAEQSSKKLKVLLEEPHQL